MYIFQQVHKKMTMFNILKTQNQKLNPEAKQNNPVFLIYFSRYNYRQRIQNGLNFSNRQDIL